MDAPSGTLLFVEPETNRTAFAVEPDTAVIAVGSRVGEPYEVGGWEVWAEFHPAYEAGDYDDVIARGRVTLEAAGYGTPLYNLACCEALSGRSEDAIEHLRAAIERRPSLRGNAKEDTTSIRCGTSPRFGSSSARRRAAGRPKTTLAPRRPPCPARQGARGCRHLR